MGFKLKNLSKVKPPKGAVNLDKVRPPKGMGVDLDPVLLKSSKAAYGALQVPRGRKIKVYRPKKL